MAAKKKQSKKVTVARYKLQTVKATKPAEMVTTYRQQVAKVQGSAGYPGQTAVQTACTNVSSGCDTLDKTLTALAKNHADGVALATTRDQQAATLNQEHGSLEALLNTVCGGIPTQVVAWARGRGNAAGARRDERRARQPHRGDHRDGRVGPGQVPDGPDGDLLPVPDGQRSAHPGAGRRLRSRVAASTSSPVSRSGRRRTSGSRSSAAGPDKARGRACWRCS